MTSLPIELAGHEVLPIALAQRCCGSNVPRPGQDGKVNALSFALALARHDAPGPGPGRTVGVLPSTHAPMKRRRGNSSEPGLGLDGIGQDAAHRSLDTKAKLQLYARARPGRKGERAPVSLLRN